jgi:hypothetical protein
MIFEVIKTILMNGGLSDEESEITGYNILKGLRKFSKSDTVTVLHLINKLKVMIDYEN